MKLQIIALAAAFFISGHYGEATAAPPAKAKKAQTAKTTKAPTAKRKTKRAGKAPATKVKPKADRAAKNRTLSAKMQRRRQARRYPSVVGRVMNYFAERSGANRQRPYVKSMALSSGSANAANGSSAPARRPQRRGNFRVRFASTGSRISTTATAGDMNEIDRPSRGGQ